MNKIQQFLVDCQVNGEADETELRKLLREEYTKGYDDGGKPAYDLAHDILADKRLPRQEAIGEFIRKTKCHLCGGWGFHDNTCPHWPRGDNSHNTEEATK